MKRNNIIKIILACFMALQMNTIYPLAEEETAEATTITEMFETAKAQNLSSETGLEYSGVTLRNQEGKELEVEAYILNDCVTLNSLGETEDQYTVVYAVASSATNSQTNSESDSSYSVNGYITITYKISTISGNKAYLLTNVKGGWNILDSSVTISDRILRYQSGGAYTTASTTKYPTANTFSYSTGYNDDHWAYGSYDICGASTFATLKHGSSSTWELEVDCMKFNPAMINPIN